MVIYHASRQDLPSISPTQHPLLRLQSGPSAAMVEPLCPPLLRGDEASRAPAPQGLPTRVNHYKLKWVIVIYRLPEKAQIRSANPPSIWTMSDIDKSSITSAPYPGQDSGIRLYRNHYLPKKYSLED
jgi:hypothetical protein